MGGTRELDDWQSCVYDGLKRARQQAWATSARHRHNYKGIDGGVDEATTRKYKERVNHIWWECPALNKHSDLGYLNLHKKRAQDNNKP
eukprot:8385553-Heterocapsa_arctica.AAC.2